MRTVESLPRRRAQFARCGRCGRRPRSDTGDARIQCSARAVPNAGSDGAQLRHQQRARDPVAQHQQLLLRACRGHVHERPLLGLRRLASRLRRFCCRGSAESGTRPRLTLAITTRSNSRPLTRCMVASRTPFDRAVVDRVPFDDGGLDSLSIAKGLFHRPALSNAVRATTHTARSGSPRFCKIREGSGPE